LLPRTRAVAEDISGASLLRTFRSEAALRSGSTVVRSIHFGSKLGAAATTACGKTTACEDVVVKAFATLAGEAGIPVPGHSTERKGDSAFAGICPMIIAQARIMLTS
jgi:hypothetical protein